MGDIERRSGVVAPPWWQFLPAGALVGAGYSLTLLGAWWGTALIILGVLSLAWPMRTRPRDMDAWKIPDMTPGQQRRMWLRLLIPHAVLGADMIAGDPWFALPATASAALSGAGMGLAVTFSSAGIARETHRAARERIGMIIRQASLDEVGTSDLIAIDRPEPRQLIHVLLAHGAIDGTRVMARQVARILDWEVDRVHAVAAPLDSRGITSRSALMAGGDSGRVFIELTEKGVVLMRELSRGR